ncbi:putative ferric-chelate reductase 1 [Pseudophryne corroboree]|uniref:putative ferric-chelate reductase 1 n=1 Tax=Pseudophryne corroboree TaxID=495146 RepID=UPI0030817AFF
MEPSIKKIIFALVIFLPTYAHAFPNGNVLPACETMEPRHGGNVSQTITAPYSLSFSSIIHAGINAFQVTLSKESDSIDFKGFLIQARAPDGTTPLGSFVVNGSDVQTLTCTTAASAASHTSATPKSRVEVIWLPPVPRVKSAVQFRATVVQQFSTFWTNIGSDIIPAASAGPELLAPTVSQFVLSFTVLSYTMLAM